MLLRYSLLGRMFMQFLNLCDYAFGFDWMTLEDGISDVQILLFTTNLNVSRVSPASAVGDFRSHSAREKFCNFIYSNAKAHPVSR